MMALFPMLLSIFISLSPTVFADTPDDGTKDPNLETEAGRVLLKRMSHMKSGSGERGSEMSDYEKEKEARIRIQEVFGPLKPKPGAEGSSGTSQ